MLVRILQNETFLTVLSGVIVFVLGQIYLENVIRPNSRFRDLKAKIACDLIFYADRYSNPLDLEETYEENTREHYKQAGEGLRKLAAEIQGFIEIRRWYNFSIPEDKDLHSVSRNLIGLSNSLWCYRVHGRDVWQENIDMVREIRELLDIETD